jgi:uncharacterized protein YndB with AHSA1/START domain
MNPALAVQVSTEQKFRCPAERVYDAWLDPGLISQWMFGPRLREETIIHILTGTVVGDTFSFLVERQGNRMDHVGKYLEMVRPTRLVFSWDIGAFSDTSSQVLIDIVANDSGCSLNLTHRMDIQWQDYADRTRDAWSNMLGVLAEILNENAGI